MKQFYQTIGLLILGHLVYSSWAAPTDADQAAAATTQSTVSASQAPVKTPKVIADCVIKCCQCIQNEDNKYTVLCNEAYNSVRPKFLEVDANAAKNVVVSSLTIVNYKFESMDDNSLANLTVEQLVFQSNTINNVKAKAFANINGLERIEFVSNKFAVLHQSALKPLAKSVKAAVFVKNEFNTAAGAVSYRVLDQINELVNLEDLTISGNNFGIADSKQVIVIQNFFFFYSGGHLMGF
jgi:hypothetical protein